MERAGRRAGLRAGLYAGCVLGGIVCLTFLLVLATAALAERYGLIEALAIMAAAAAALVVILLIALAIEGRRHRKQAALRARLDQQMLQAAAMSMVPNKAPSRPVAGLALVAVGALLILARRASDD